jgi:hypothetical protein
MAATYHKLKHRARWLRCCPRFRDHTCKAQDKDHQLAGTVDGNKVGWQYEWEYGGSPLTLIYTATLDDSGKIAGTVEVQPFGVIGDFTETSIVKQACVSKLLPSSGKPLSAVRFRPRLHFFAETNELPV